MKDFAFFVQGQTLQPKSRMGFFNPEGLSNLQTDCIQKFFCKSIVGF